MSCFVSWLNANECGQGHVIPPLLFAAPPF